MGGLYHILCPQSLPWSMAPNPETVQWVLHCKKTLHSDLCDEMHVCEELCVCVTMRDTRKDNFNSLVYTDKNIIIFFDSVTFGSNSQTK